MIFQNLQTLQNQFLPLFSSHPKKTRKLEQHPQQSPNFKKSK